MRRYRWFAALPAIGMLGGIPFANRVHPYIAGMPFLLAWIVGWVIATSIIMCVIYRLDSAHDAADAVAESPRNRTSV